MNKELREEIQFTRKVRCVLDHSADRLDREVRGKLHAARERALARQKIVVSRLSFAGIGHLVGDVLLPQARTLTVLLTLCVAVVGSYYWNHFRQASENAEIDSALLAGDLPINAYLDHGFHTWLERPSASSQQ